MELLIVAPDCIKETFKETINYEGHNAGKRAVRYMQWITDPDPNDTIFNYDLVIELKENGDLRLVVDRQICGVFPRQAWLDLLAEAGFKAKEVEDSSTEGEVNERLQVFVGIKK